MSLASVQTATLTPVEVCAQLVDALELDLVGPWAGHVFANERLPGWVRPSSWYLTGFLIPSGTPPAKSARTAGSSSDIGVRRRPRVAPLVWTRLDYPRIGIAHPEIPRWAA